jgi:hypothetical protein
VGAFTFNPPSLKLYVELCASSQFLSEILINNPGMVDELLDSLVLNQPRTYQELRDELVQLCHGADDPDPILHSFKDKELLRIGVRDILGKDDIVHHRPERFWQTILGRSPPWSIPPRQTPGAALARAKDRESRYVPWASSAAAK